MTERHASREGGSARFLQLPTMISNFLPSSRAFGCALCSLLIAGTATASPPPLIRFPSSSAEQVAFVARGDLWIAPKDGGKASRLTEGGDGIVAAKLSPDGKWVAYSQQTGGRRDVYVVQAAGGTPRRLTFDGRASPAGNLVVAWGLGSDQVVFLSDRESVSSKQIQAFIVPIAGGLAAKLPMDQAGSLAFSPDGSSIAYTRTFTSLAARKRYVGGQAEDIYVYETAKKALRRITDWKGTDTAPMWDGRNLYFLSDRGPGFRMNLWRYSFDTERFEQLTHFADFDIDTPSLGGGRITFQQGGRLWAFGLDDAKLRAIAIDVPHDQTRTRVRAVDASALVQTMDVSGVTDFGVSPSTLVASALGELFTYDLASGSSRNLTQTPDAYEQHPALSPNGEWLAYVTHDGHAQQLAVRPSSGGSERALTRFASGVLYRPTFSPDARWLALATAGNELWLVPREKGSPRLVHTSTKREIRDAAFSPDGRWLAYSTTRETGVSAIRLHEISTGKEIGVSSPMESDRLPVFSEDSQTVYFVSRRHERPLTSDRGDEASFATIASDGLYGIRLAQLQKNGSPPSAFALPVTGGRIVSLHRRANVLYYSQRPTELLNGEDPSSASQLRAYDLARSKDEQVLEEVETVAISDRGGPAVIGRGSNLYTVDLGIPNPSAHQLDLEGFKVNVEPRKSWSSSFNYAWMLDRDLFFSPSMNGSDWSQVRARYRKFLPLLGSQDDFNYLMRQMQGELATSHAFVAESTVGTVQQPPTGKLGADFALDEESGRYYLRTVLKGDPSRAKFRSPLFSPATGVDVQPGTFVLAIDGQPLKAPAVPDELLVGKTGTVVLTVANQAGGQSKDVSVTPLINDYNLRLYDWIRANRERVSELSDGKLGYVFLSDFADAGSEDFVRQFQGQLDKQGLIFDVRWNRGGFTSQAILSILRRVHAGLFVNRQGGIEPLPLFVAPRAMAVLTNEHSASDGDQFPYYFRQYGLGPLIGQRTWGGVQGIKGFMPLMDGTRITIPKDSLASTSGHWLIENEGVSPDIEIVPSVKDFDPESDRHLETAVAELLKRAAPAGLTAPAPLPAYPQGGDVPPAAFGR